MLIFAKIIACYDFYFLHRFDEIYGWFLTFFYYLNWQYMMLASIVVYIFLLIVSIGFKCVRLAKNYGAD